MYNHIKFRSDQICNKNMNVVLVRTILDYGCISYGSAAKTLFKMLEVVHFYPVKRVF